jgi:hypothetical protein
MENNPNSQENVKEKNLLPVTEEEKLAMAEDLVLTGACKYTFKLLNKYPVVLTSLTFKEQEELTKEIALIPNEVTTFEGQNEDGSLKTGKRSLTVSEYNLEITKLSLSRYIYSYNEKLISSIEDLENIGDAVIKLLSTKVRAFTNTIDSVINTPETIKN